MVRRRCYGLNYFPSNSQIFIYVLGPSEMVFGDGVFGKQLGLN
jgi:hypothetical protein